jgi:hypothetical protein
MTTWAIVTLPRKLVIVIGMCAPWPQFGSSSPRISLAVANKLVADAEACTVRIPAISALARLRNALQAAAVSGNAYAACCCIFSKHYD